jgi:hypothetical protein
MIEATIDHGGVSGKKILIHWRPAEMRRRAEAARGRAAPAIHSPALLTEKMGQTAKTNTADRFRGRFCRTVRQ